MQKFGIDISKWQKGFDFDKAKEEGVSFAILRAAYSGKKDTQFDTFYKQCKEKGIQVGAYHYSMAETVEDAEKEAAKMLEILSGKQFEYPIYLDVEDACQKKLGKDKLTEIILAYCDKLEKAWYYVGIYSTYAFLKDYTHIDKLKRYDKWIAQWSNKCTCPILYGMWQFGGETNKLRDIRVAGVVCDQNYACKDYPSIVKNAGLNGFLNANSTNNQPAAENPEKTVLELAREVIAGKWGTGINRKKRLEQAGYDYRAVQNKVNEII